MGRFDVSNQVKPIRFQSIPEDGVQKNTTRRKLSDNEDIEMKISKQQKLEPNFSFEYSYPAVIFDKVCFTIDKSKQQANFLNECLYKLKNCVKLSSDNGSDQSQKVDILKSINLSVPYGSIFGLLGPSSCGKTTLLRCLVGLLKPNSGYIRLFGHNSEVSDGTKSYCCGQSKSKGRRSNKCKVPGANVGYMPQDLGLYEDFTIRQLLTMFGQYMGMGSELIVTRIDFMAKFLDLPNVDRQICSLSGGQKRRVSFSIACLHMPPLIILDEPTVGVDPLLRKSIWKYLRRLANEENKTIIITTHYIEEAAQADQVALMRSGEILVQDTPQRIMEANGCKSLEEAFLKICNNVQRQTSDTPTQRYKLYPQPRFNWHDKLKIDDADVIKASTLGSLGGSTSSTYIESDKDSVVRELKLRAQEKLALFDGLQKGKTVQLACQQHNVKLDEKINKFSMAPNMIEAISRQPKTNQIEFWDDKSQNGLNSRELNNKIRSFKGTKLVLNDTSKKHHDANDDELAIKAPSDKSIYQRMNKLMILMYALIYKNYRRNVNSIPLLAFQFMLPIIQMISFSLCVGGRPTNIGLGVVNFDQPIQLVRSDLLMSAIQPKNTTTILSSDYEEELDNYRPLTTEELLSTKYLNFIDKSMITIKYYDNLKDALNDVRRAKLWAAMEIGENFTTTILRRFDLENFYQLELSTIQQSVIKLYPDRSNKVLDMICHRSLVNSYRTFLLNQFEHFKRLPIEVKEPIFDIKPNIISNSIDGYTESIAAGLLASLTYIMAAGLTTFIMVVERSAGILERTFTSGINPVAYLLAHAVFRSIVMMAQIAVVMFLTFYLLQQPLVGSIWLAYFMLMTLNLTGISYGLLISSLVTDQNGAALAIVSSLVVKITMSGILWPFEAIPRWLRTICYVQPLTMPIQALKAITLKGATLEDRAVQLGFLVSISWLALFLTISAKRFKFYQY